MMFAIERDAKRAENECRHCEELWLLAMTARIVHSRRIAIALL